MKRLALTLSLLFIVASCGGGGGGSSDKSLFSLWTADINGAVLDFSDFGFGANSTTIFLTSGAVCNCAINFTGDEGEGIISIYSCSLYSGSGDCGTQEGSFRYSKAPELLTSCNTATGVCYTWH